MIKIGLVIKEIINFKGRQNFLESRLLGISHIHKRINSILKLFILFQRSHLKLNDKTYVIFNKRFFVRYLKKSLARHNE